jgi:hypothetical protein
MKNPLLTIIMTALLMASRTTAQENYVVRGGAVELTVSPKGEITGVGKRKTTWKKALQGLTLLGECVQSEEIRTRRLAGGGLQFTKTFVSGDGKSRCTVVDRFLPERSSVRWEVELEGDGDPWSTGISTKTMFTDTAGARFWTTWGDPDHLSPAARTEERDIWHNPFESRTFRPMHLVYGGHFAKGGGYAIPVFSVLYPGEETGVSLLMSPHDPLLDLQMITSPQGEVRQTRKFNRLERGRRLTFTMHIFLHEPDWRAVMAFVVGKYPRYFVPRARNANEICGMGAYSSYEGEIDVATYRKMGGILNWKASFDFSYMGMFIPPVKTDTTKWKRFDVNSGGELIEGRASYTSIAQLRTYAKRMKKLGFFTLNYFNVTEFGGVSEYAKAVLYPAPQFSEKQDVWTNPSAFLHGNFPGAILFGALDHEGWHSLTPHQLMNSPVRFHEQPFWTWGGAIATDVGDPSYARFLLDQARLHVKKIPDANGICIDRFDWFNEYNWHADDGKSWVGGKPVRSLLNSYKSFIPGLSRIMHSAGKVIFCNPHMNRLELMEHIDGIYNEFGHIGHNRNLSVFLTFYKPLVCWTPDKETVLKSPDAYFQSHVLLGAFPTAPFPGNDHTIGPDPEVEKRYLEYGAMFNHLRGRTWVLIPNVVEVRDDAALCNLFTVGKKVVVPVVMGKGESVEVRIRHCNKLLRSSSASVETWYPGEKTPVRGKGVIRDNELTLKIPLRRGCAFLVLAPT